MESPGLPAIRPPPSFPKKVFGDNPFSFADRAPLEQSTPLSLTSTHIENTTTPSTPKPKQVSKRPSPTSSLAAANKKPISLKASSSNIKRSSTSIDTLQLRNDRLGTLVRSLCTSLDEASSWETFVEDFRGPSYLSSDLDKVEHPATELLKTWRDEGVPAETDSLPWTEQQKDECIQRGCHPSANIHSNFLRQEMAEFIDNRFWTVLPYDTVKHLEQLMLSPAAVKEERERKPRLLCDLSWPWSWGSVNEHTVPTAPPEAMQFGGTLLRILTALRHSNPRFGPPRLAKHDLKDGFYRLFLRAQDCLRLAIILPRYEDECQLVAIPLACPMGWVQSPPKFSTMSETICDNTNASFSKSPSSAQPHRLSTQAAECDDIALDWTPRPREPEHMKADAQLSEAAPAFVHNLPQEDSIAPPSNMMSTKPLGNTDVFVDDFIQLGQGGPRRMNALRDHLLHEVDRVLATPDVSIHQRNEAVSIKKLLKGDGSWSTRKLILGWIVDTIRQTIELPPHRKLTLATIFSDLQHRTRISRKTYEKYLGQLRFVSVAIPGSASLFCVLQNALNTSTAGRVRLNRCLQSHISTFASLAANVQHRPTHLAEIIPQEPSYLGATDAAKAGMGGVFYDSSGQGYIWRFPFPLEVQRQLVSVENPAGRITNSDLEQCGILAQLYILTTNFPVQYATISTASDNTPAVARFSKGAVSHPGLPAYLCNLASCLQRKHRYCHTTHYIEGPSNIMADDASRLQHLSDEQFLLHFSQHYPQEQAWQLLHLTPEHSSMLISTLLSRLPPNPPQSSIEPPKTSSSATGPTSAPLMESILPSVMSQIKKAGSATCSSMDSDTANKARPVTLSGLAQWTKPYWRWARGSPTWVNQIHESKYTQTSSIPYSLLSSKLSPTTTTPKPEPIRST